MDIRCQQFTSFDIADNMLDMIDYKTNLYGKKVLENSCGKGNILSLIVERYILDSIASGIELKLIVQGLENDIYGVEIVKETYNACISNLNEIAARYEIENVNWKIIRADMLSEPFNITFDYVIGNPPYISYKNLEIEVRNFIKEKFITCKHGKPDYCYAFIESAINYLHDGGKMAYLVPNSIFKNVFGKELRQIISPHIIKIYDYPNCKLFDKALTSSAIMILEKGSNEKNLEYIDVSQKHHFLLKKSHLGEKWTFCNVFKNSTEETIKFEELFKASITIATQRNGIFIISKEIKDKNKIENGILRKAISPRNQKYGNKQFIIFPYIVKNGKVYRYSECEFMKKYPNTYRYLSENRKELEKRDADKNSKWFEYGRSQAIQNMNKSMLLVSTVVTNKISVYNVNTSAIPYSGIYIIAEQEHTLNLAKEILESKTFFKYVKGIGTPASGSSLRITADDINRFEFKREELLQWLR